MPTDALLHALTALHHTLATKWLLREFRMRGAPPTAADMATVISFEHALEALHERGFEDMGAITKLLETLAAHPTTPRKLRGTANECLRKLREEEWVEVVKDEEELESGEWVGVARGDDEVHV
ncbi:uncharacterized protein H6S33_010017 [Morchella sextelata]|uniref:uncharacterized protein n=1 Tax=Morchella sextelata TaxID=1174677 RepID=UPI001D03C514|nr:uncharacterized protein H6S33_010017 [Morchella sextelata]KAH0611965.1 hypothetical protein H6S33_010017 [Morchella sextelata]